MFGKAEWFTYRSMGWGIAPRTWQGWLYIMGFAAVGAALNQLPIASNWKGWMMAILLGIFLFDVAIIWSQLGKQHDERQRMHQLIIERNCSLAAIFSILAVIGYRAYQNRMLAGPGFPVDPLLFAVLGTMALTKLLSSLYLRWKM